MPIASFGRCVISSCLLTAAVAVPVASAAQSGPTVSLGLSDAIVAAWRGSADARAAEYALAAATGRTRQAGARPNPILVYSREQTSSAGVQNQQDIFAFEQTLELGGATRARIAAANAREQAALARLSSLRAQVTFETTRAYALAVSARQRLKLADETAGVFSRAVSVSARQLSAGDVSGYANRRIRLEAARYATVRAAEQLDARTTTLTLAALVSGTADSIARLQFELVDSIRLAPAVVAESVDSLVVRAWSLRGDIKALEFEAAAARFDARLATAARVPQPAITLGLKSERAADVSGRGLVLGLSMPVPTWDRRSGEISATTADASRRSAEVVALKRRVAREVAEAIEAFKAAELALQSLRDALGESAQRSLSAIQVAWLEGEIRLVEWLDAVRAYQEAEAVAIGLRAQVMIRRAALDLALGHAGPLTAANDVKEETPR